MLWHHAYQWYWLPEHYNPTHYFCHRNYDLNRKIKNIEDLSKQVHNLYLQIGFKITLKHADSKFEPLREEMADIGMSLHCASKK